VRNVLDIVEKAVLCSVTFFTEDRAVYEMMWKKCLVAFPLQKWLRERTALFYVRSLLVYFCVLFL
jgi:hypothetical protein